MSNELNIVNEETTETIAETCSGEDKGVKDENKIVPIINKANSAESENTAPSSETAAQLVAQHASQPSAAPVEQPSAASPVEPAVQQKASDAPDTRDASANASPNSASTNADYTASASDEDFSQNSRRQKRRSFRFEPEDDFDFDEDERPKKRFFHLRSANDEESRDKLILSRIKDEDLMEYLALEQRRLEFLQQAKEAKEKRILIAFQLLISLAAIVGITYLLQDNPTILISILYIVGIVAALNVWKNPHDKGRGKRYW